MPLTGKHRRKSVNSNDKQGWFGARQSLQSPEARGTRDWNLQGTSG